MSIPNPTYQLKVADSGDLEVHGYERVTRQGADHSVRILIDGTWIKLSVLHDWPDSKVVFEGKEEGFMHYSMTLGKFQTWGHFYRSNGGNEEVMIMTGACRTVEFKSFERAEIWGQEYCFVGDTND